MAAVETRAKGSVSLESCAELENALGLLREVRPLISDDREAVGIIARCENVIEQVLERETSLDASCSSREFPDSLDPVPVVGGAPSAIVTDNVGELRRSKEISGPTRFSGAEGKRKRNLPRRRPSLERRAVIGFEHLVKSKNGKMSKSDLRVALVELGVDDDKLDVSLAHLIPGMDHDGDGKFDVEDFITLLTREDFDDGVLSYLQHVFTEWVFTHEFTNRYKEMVYGNDWLIDPRSRFSTNWDIFVAILLVTVIFTMPLSMAFTEAQDNLYALDLTADVVFILDIVKHFNTGYLDDFEFAIMDRKRVRDQYLATWFIPDVLSSVPIEIIELVATTGGDGAYLRASKLLKLLRLSRIAKIFRIMKLSKLAKTFQEIRDYMEDNLEIHLDNAKLAIGKLFLSLLVLSHWVGCINFMLCREYGFPQDSWVAQADLIDAALGTTYSWCFFKALSQMIGLGFESPPLVNTVCYERTEWCTIEHWITLVCLYIGSVFYAFVISGIAFVMANVNVGASNLSKEILKINDYTKHRKVPGKLKGKVRNFFRLQFGDGKLYDEKEVLANLPPTLRDEIYFFSKGPIIETIPVLNRPETPEALRFRVARCLTPRAYFKGETIVHEGRVGTEMYFINSGLLEVLTQHREFMVKVLADGCYFGDVSLLLGCKRTASIRAKTMGTLSVLERDVFLGLTVDFPLFDRYVRKIAQKRYQRMAEHAATEEEQAVINMFDEEDSATKFFAKLDDGGAAAKQIAAALDAEVPNIGDWEQLPELAPTKKYSSLQKPVQRASNTMDKSMTPIVEPTQANVPPSSSTSEATTLVSHVEGALQAGDMESLGKTFPPTAAATRRLKNQSTDSMFAGARRNKPVESSEDAASRATSKPTSKAGTPNSGISGAKKKRGKARDGLLDVKLGTSA